MKSLGQKGVSWWLQQCIKKQWQVKHDEQQAAQPHTAGKTLEQQNTSTVMAEATNVVQGTVHKGINSRRN
jgi:hypothetical protein